MGSSRVGHALSLRDVSRPLLACHGRVCDGEWLQQPVIRLALDNLEGSSQEPPVFICSQEDSLGKGSWKSYRLEMVKRKRQGRLSREGAAWTMKASKTRGGRSWQCGDLKALGFLRDGLCSCRGHVFSHLILGGSHNSFCFALGLLELFNLHVNLLSNKPILGC